MDFISFYNGINNSNIIFWTVNACGLKPCKNDAICMDQGDSYMCMCKAGFKGPICEIGEYGSSDKKSNMKLNPTVVLTSEYFHFVLHFVLINSL